MITNEPITKEEWHTELFWFRRQVHQAKQEADRELACTAALELASEFDDGLESDRVHYRTTDGTFLTKLDEVVRAFLDDDLVIGPK